MGSQPEKVDFQGNPKVGHRPDFFMNTPPRPNFLSGPCLYQVGPYYHQCTDKVSLGPAATIFNAVGHALGYLFQGFCSKARKGLSSCLYNLADDHFVKVRSLISSSKLQFSFYLDQVDQFFCGWPYCQATSFVCETDTCNQFSCLYARMQKYFAFMI